MDLAASSASCCQMVFFSGEYRLYRRLSRQPRKGQESKRLLRTTTQLIPKSPCLRLLLYMKIVEILYFQLSVIKY